MPIGKKLKKKLDELHAPYIIGTLVSKDFEVGEIVDITPDHDIPDRKVYHIKPLLYMYGDEVTPLYWRGHNRKTYHIDEYKIVSREELIKDIQDTADRNIKTVKEVLNG